MNTYNQDEVTKYAAILIAHTLERGGIVLTPDQVAEAREMLEKDINENNSFEGLVAMYDEMMDKDKQLFAHLGLN